MFCDSVLRGLCGIEGHTSRFVPGTREWRKVLIQRLCLGVPIATAGLTVKIGLIVTKLLHEVDLVLGINWLQLVNPVVDWGGAKLYVPNAVETTLLQGIWLEGHVQAGAVTVLAGKEELKCMRDKKMQNQISILKCPKFWRQTNATMNVRSNSFEGRAKYDVE